MPLCNYEMQSGNQLRCHISFRADNAPLVGPQRNCYHEPDHGIKCIERLNVFSGCGIQQYRGKTTTWWFMGEAGITS